MWREWKATPQTKTINIFDFFGSLVVVHGWRVPYSICRLCVKSDLPLYSGILWNDIAGVLWKIKYFCAIDNFAWATEWARKQELEKCDNFLPFYNCWIKQLICFHCFSLSMWILVQTQKRLDINDTCCNAKQHFARKLKS